MSAKGSKAKKMVARRARSSSLTARRERQLRLELGYPSFLVRLVGAARLTSMAAESTLEHRCD